MHSDSIVSQTVFIYSFNKFFKKRTVINKIPTTLQWMCIPLDFKILVYQWASNKIVQQLLELERQAINIVDLVFFGKMKFTMSKLQ